MGTYSFSMGAEGDSSHMIGLNLDGETKEAKYSVLWFKRPKDEVAVTIVILQSGTWTKVSEKKYIVELKEIDYSIKTGTAPDVVKTTATLPARTVTVVPAAAPREWNLEFSSKHDKYDCSDLTLGVDMVSSIKDE